jgi:hypothetical protein
MKQYRRRILVGVYVALLTFFTYTCVFAFRKPFTVALFENYRLLGLPYQTVLIISQVIGYMLSKFMGIRLISSLSRNHRWRPAAWLMGTGWLSLLFFAVLPYTLGPFCFLVNGFCMGFMWGIVYSYAEGRKATDMIGSSLAVSFIFAGGFTRSVARYLMLNFEVSAFWVPFLTGLVFVLPLIILFYLLELAPGPDHEDFTERVERVSMSKEHRRKIFSSFRFGLIVIAVGYGMLTIVRDIRDNYMSNIWRELGYADSASIFTTSETRISLVVLIVMALLVLVRNNIKAFMLIHAMICVGFVISLVSSLLFLFGKVDGSVWMQTAGLGLYMAYIPYNAVFFDRMIASFRIIGNVGFLIYLIDAFGYLGSVFVMLTKSWMSEDVSWSNYFAYMVVGVGMLGCIGTLISSVYFIKKYRLQVANQL